MKLIFDVVSANKKRIDNFFYSSKFSVELGQKFNFFAKNNNKLFPSRLIHLFSCQFSLIKFICCLYIATHPIVIIILPIPFIFFSRKLIENYIHSKCRRVCILFDFTYLPRHFPDSQIRQT